MRITTTYNRKNKKRRVASNAKGMDSCDRFRDESYTTPTADTMEALQSMNPSSILSLPSRYGIILMVGCCCMWSLTMASGFQQGFAASARLMDRRRAKEDSFSLITLEAIPGKRTFTGVRKTRRDYKSNAEMEEPMTKDKETFQVITQDKESGKNKRLVIGKRIRSMLETNQNPDLASLKTSISKQNKKKVLVKNVEELRHAILDQQLSLSETKIEEVAAVTPSTEESPLMDHAVRQLIRERYLTKSIPGNRNATDTATLAIAIEGGGMRGCVSAGMVAAITALGLTDTIDTIYGSSAGSVVGAYMVSRQMCMDVYVDILPASKKLFVCKKRMIANLAALGVGRMLSNTSPGKVGNMPSTPSLKERLSSTPPGMSIEFVLDGILGEKDGLRPLDIDSFKVNGKHQKLRVVSSCVDPNTEKLYSKCFGNEDFFCEENSVVRADQKREGIFACLQASMTVPGATGPPVDLVRKNSINEKPLPCFDAFCFEPIPYRSAVEEGATHVVVLASRPEDFIPPTKQGVYETAIAPLYFDSHGQRKVSDFFANGGQQYLYAEDLMLLEEAKNPSKDGVLVPPPEILYGVDRSEEVSETIQDREETWNRAHLFPLRVPKGYKELATLEQDKDEVLEAVRDGFMTAFDALSDIVGLEGLKGKDVAQLVFPSSDADDKEASSVESTSSASTPTQSADQHILNNRLFVPGQPIPMYEAPEPTEENTSEEEPRLSRRKRFFRRIKRRRSGLFGRKHRIETSEKQVESEQQVESEPIQNGIILDEEEFSATALLECLPGFQNGNYNHLAKGLFQEYLQEQKKKDVIYRNIVG